MTRFPSVREVAEALRSVSQQAESPDGEWLDVRLQVYDNGEWYIRVGDAQYDTDHRGYWGADSVPGVYKGRVHKFNAMAVARNLIREAKDQHAEEHS